MILLYSRSASESLQGDRSRRSLNEDRGAGSILSATLFHCFCKYRRNALEIVMALCPEVAARVNLQSELQRLLQWQLAKLAHWDLCLAGWKKRQTAATTGCTSPDNSTAPCYRDANRLMKGSFFEGPLSHWQEIKSRRIFFCSSTVQHMMPPNICSKANQLEIPFVAHETVFSGKCTPFRTLLYSRRAK